MLTPENLLEIRDLAGLNQGQFASEIGVSREVVNKMESGKMKPSKKTVAKVEMYLQKQQNGVKSGDVNILGKSSQQSKKSSSKESFQAQRLLQKNTHQQLMVPLVAIKAQAGYIRGFEEADYAHGLDQYSLPPGVNPTGAVWRYFEVDGESMEPTLYAGDVVLATLVYAEDWNDTRNFCVYIILTEGQLLIKRLYNKSSTEWVLISDNEEAAPQVVVSKEKVKELWLLRRHIRNRVPAPREFRITA